MAVCAANPVNVVGAFRAGECCVHLFDVDAAVGHLGVAVFARGGSVFIVACVARETADAFVHPNRRAIIARSNLRTPVVCGGYGSGLRLAWRVALIAQRLALVRADCYRARTV